MDEYKHKLGNEYLDGEEFSLESQMEFAEDDNGNPIINLVATDETQVRRFYADLILDHDPESIDMSRAKNGMSWLYNHHHDMYIGKCVDAEIRHRKLYLKVTPDMTSEFAREKYQSIKSGHLQKVSIGFSILEYEEDGVTEDNAPIYRVTKWQPHEISSVTVPAIDSVGVYSQELPEPSMTFSKLEEKLEVKEDEKPKITGVKSMGEDSVKILEMLKSEEYKDYSEIGVRVMNEGGTVQDFQTAVLKHVTATSDEPVTTAEFDKTAEVDNHPADQPAGLDPVGFETKDLRRFSLEKVAMYVMSNHSEVEKAKADVELSMMKEAREEYRNRGQEFSEQGEWAVPWEAVGGTFAQNIRLEQTLQKYGYEAYREAIEEFELTAGVAADGGNLVETVLRADQFVPALIDASQTLRYLSTLDGLTGNVDIPTGTGTVTAAWLTETGAVTASDPSFGKVTGTPHRLSIATTMSHQVMFQSMPAVEMILRRMMPQVGAAKIDETVIQGSGSGAVPGGWASVTGIGKSTRGTNSGATISWQRLLEARRTLLTNNTFQTGVAPWFVSPAMWSALANCQVASTERSSGGQVGAVTGGIDELALRDDGTVLGSMVHTSNNVPTNDVWHVVPQWTFLCSWGMPEFLLDPYSGAGNAQSHLYFTMWVDVVHTRPGAIFRSTAA